MNVETTELAPAHGLYGKLMGVLQYRHQLKPLSESLAVPGVRDLEVLDGPQGVVQLEQWKEGVSQYFFGDMEGEMLRRYLDAVTNNFIVFAAVVDSDTANAAAEAAKTHGATEVTHFGNSVITNY